MTKSIFARKRFWLAWIILSLIGAFIGYYHSAERDKKLSNASIVELREYRALKYPSIIAIENLRYQEEYLRVLEDSSIKHLNIPFRALHERSTARLIGFNEDGSLAQIAITNDRIDAVNPPYLELWISSKFLSLDARPSDQLDPTIE